MAYRTEDIRNIALVGTAGAGKTTLAEMLLYRAGAVSQAGSVEKGNTVSDFDQQEQVHGHSLESSILSMDYHGGHINLLDTPGYPDFLGRAISVLPAVETCAVVIDARSGPDNTSMQMMVLAAERGLDRVIIVNHIDDEQADLAGVMSRIQEIWGSGCLPMNLPAANGREVIDCFFQTDGQATDFSSVAEAHTNIVDQVVELDEELMELYLEQGEEITPEQLHDPFEEALREGHLIPVCFVSAASGAGIDQLLEILARLMPNPLEGNPPQFLKGDGDGGEPVSVSPDANGHVLAHVFKITIDPFVGRLGVFRVHQGKITRDSQLYIGDGRKPFKVGHLLKLQGKEHREVPHGIPGDICAVAKVDEVHFDAVLHDSHEEDHLHLKSLQFPPPMYGLAIEAKSRGDEQKISDALRKLEAEDPSFRVEHNAGMNETVIRGLGELHLRIMLEKLRDRYNVEVETRPPRIAYRETITAKAEGHHRHKKQTGGAGQFGEVFLRIEPMTQGGGFEFIDEVVGGVIPRQFIPAVEKGIRQALDEGIIAGYPMQDIRVTVYDGKHHSVDSKEVAFVSAGKKAFIDAVKKARPVLMEPVVEISISAPGESMGDIAADLSAKRGRVTDTRAGSDGTTMVTGLVPLSELGNYQNELKSMTGGAGTFSMALHHHDPVPSRVQQELMDAYKQTDNE